MAANVVSMSAGVWCVLIGVPLMTAGLFVLALACGARWRASIVAGRKAREFRRVLRDDAKIREFLS